MWKKTNIETSKAFRAEWQRTLNARENYLSDIQKKLDQLANDEQDRIARDEVSELKVGDRVRKKTPPEPWGLDGWIKRDGMIVEIGYHLETMDDSYYNPTEVYRPEVQAWAKVQWDQTPNQKKNNRKGNLRRITLSEIERVSYHHIHTHTQALSRRNPT